ncbi:amino acid adenylation domain-containing protein [Streptomyces sp. NPDC050636]|uniref:amino acid adenylation domain-containing protein n=1 Tax=Streptomyces sp. NPDC050636 TaxID=3154510 RepID=UPI003418356B
MSSDVGYRDVPVHVLVERRALIGGDRVAVVDGTDSVSYAGLVRRSDDIAAELLARNVRRGDLVGVCLPRGIDAVASLLAILKVGGTCVPLALEQPVGRLAFIREDSGLAVTVTTTETAEQIGIESGRTVCLDTDIVADSASRLGSVPVEVSGDDVAYALYTSGSTGAPKAALLTHANISNFVLWCLDEGLVDGDSRVAHATNLGFDAAIFDIFAPLAVGAVVCVVHREVIVSPAATVRWFVENEITVGFLTTRVAEACLAEPWPADAAMRCLVTGGEQVTMWLPAHIPFKVLQIYGPTECTVCVATMFLPPEPPGGGVPPFGRPIRNTRIYLLDPSGQLVADGEPGELYISGAGVGAGYLDRSELTAQRYLPDPFVPGARMYRTGDLCRMNPEGNLEFVGRMDHQVKLRGHRIELNEVEAALASHPDVNDVVVLLREDRPGDKRLTAYFTYASGDEPPATSDLRRHISERLPYYMIPTGYVSLSRFPLTPNNKVDRNALPAPSMEDEAGEIRPTSGVSDLVDRVRAIWEQTIGVTEIGLDDTLFELGGSSLHVPEIHRRISDLFDAPELGMIDVFNYPTLRTYTTHLAKLIEGASSATRTVTRSVPAPETADDDSAIAIIGMSGQFPGARTVDELWSLLREGREGITHEIPGRTETDWVASAGLIADRDGFDPQLFDLSPADAELMDPQMRRFLETAWAALEDAGYAPRTQGLPPVGVFGGSSFPRDWAERFAASRPEPGTTAERRFMNGNPWQNLATQVAYRLGLTGPAVDVQTACSTSLVAVHLACRSLIEGDCDLALAGGVGLTQSAGYYYEEGGILSPDGRCRPFDAEAQGTLPGNGVGVVVLKPLNRALADHDTVHAVIRGSAVNNDGALKVGFFAPSIEGQRKVVQSAWRAANVSAESISYIETHGTATVLGDSVEVNALTQAVRADTDRTGFCALGSAKSNLGHLDAAAGVTGLIKAALAVKNGVIPATLHFRKPNAELDTPNSPFYVNATTIPWPDSGSAPRRAAVSGFGVGGTNAHVVLDAPPAPQPVNHAAGPQLVPISARTPAALETISRRLADNLSTHQHPLGDVAFTLRHGRGSLQHRRAMVCHTTEDAVATLRDVEQHRGFTGVADSRRPLRLVFMFPGVGTQHPGMGRDLYDRHPVYRTALDRCSELFERSLGTDIRELLFPESGQEESAEEQLLRPSRNMAAIFATEYSLAVLLDSWGIRPDAVIGHSLGEYTASCVSGILSVEGAVKLVARRGELCDELPESAMLAVSLDMSTLADRLDERLTVAAMNGPRSNVVSGPIDAIREFQSTLDADGIRARQLPMKAGLHSPLVEPFMGQFARFAATVSTNAPRVPVVSNVTGDWLPKSGIIDLNYWAQHLRQTVQFEKGLTTLLDSADDNTVLVEVGPGKTLTTLTRLHSLVEKVRGVIPALPVPTSPGTERDSLLETIAQLWCDGVEIDWSALDAGEQHARIQLPTYAFERSATISENGTPAIAAERSRKVVTDEAELARGLAELWGELLGVPDPHDEDNFFDRGGHSLLAVEFSTRVRQELGSPVGPHLLLEHPTFRELVSHIQQLAVTGERLHAEPSGILTELQQGNPGQTPIFMVQPIGGTVFTYQAFARHLGVDRPVHAFRAVGLEVGEKPYESITEMASRYVDELLAVQPNGPHVIGGHSSGGVVAYEMAYQLIERGIDKPLVVMIDTVTSEQSHSLQNVSDVEKLVDTLLDIAPESTAALRTAIAEDPLIRGVVMQTNLALASYYPKPCAADIIYFLAAERDEVLDPRAGEWWANYCEGEMEMHTVPGNHFSVMEEPQIAQIAELLISHWNRTEGVN